MMAHLPLLISHWRILSFFRGHTFISGDNLFQSPVFLSHLCKTGFDALGLDVQDVIFQALNLSLYNLPFA